MWVVLALLVGKFALTVFSYATGRTRRHLRAAMLVIGALDRDGRSGQVTMAVAPHAGHRARGMRGDRHGGAVRQLRARPPSPAWCWWWR